MMVAAALAVCLAANPKQCVINEFRIDRRACGLSYPAEIPQGGQWVPAIAGIRCKPQVPRAPSLTKAASGRLFQSRSHAVPH